MKRKRIDSKRWFRNLYQRLFYWLEWYFSTERKDPFRCTECGSVDVEIKIWSKVNQGGEPSGDCEEYDGCYCNGCENNVRILSTSIMLKETEEWWHRRTLEEKGLLSGFRKHQFDPPNDCQLFETACNNWWAALSVEEKVEYWLSN